MNGWKCVVMAGMIGLVSACAADPYNVYPDAAKVERIVTGPASLQVQEPNPNSSEYRIFEGRPIADGGLIWKPFYLTDAPVSPSVGGAILARKARWGEVFGLLTNGAVGESFDNRLVPRVSASEFTAYERGMIDSENADREMILGAELAGRRIPAMDADAVRRVFAYTRLQLMPDGVWVERQPGQWSVRGGLDYRSRVMDREPIGMAAAPSSELEAPPEPELRLEAPTPRLRR